MSLYPVTLKRDQDGVFVATFIDVPEAITQGETREEALIAARDALETAFDFYLEDHRELPSPSVAKRGQAIIEVSAFPPRLKPT